MSFCSPLADGAATKTAHRGNRGQECDNSHGLTWGVKDDSKGSWEQDEIKEMTTAAAVAAAASAVTTSGRGGRRRKKRRKENPAPPSQGEELARLGECPA